MLTVPPGGSANVTGLEEFSTYVVRVTPVGGRESSTIEISTMAAGNPRYTVYHCLILLQWEVYSRMTHYYWDRCCVVFF